MTEPNELHPGKRVCQLIKLKPECLEEYKKLHATPWKPVLANLTRYHIEDYSIHYAPEFDLLVASFKYTGSNWEQDAEAMRVDPSNHPWWAVTDAMQTTLVEGSTGSQDVKGWWQDLEEVFRVDH